MIDNDRDHDSHNTSQRDLHRKTKGQYQNAKIQFKRLCQSKLLTIIEPVKEFLKDDAGNLTGAVISTLKPERDPETGRTRMVPTGEEFTYDCQLAFIAAGFTGCETSSRYSFNFY